MYKYTKMEVVTSLVVPLAILLQTAEVQMGGL